DVEHVINAAHDPVVTVFVFAGAVAGEVHAGNLRPVLLHVAVGVAVDGAGHAGPGLLKDEKSAGTFGNGFAVHGDNFRYDAGKCGGGGAGLSWNRAGNWREHDVSGFGLPPGIDDGAAITADDFAIPHPGFRIDGLADSAEKPQARHVVLVRPLVAPLDEGADC